MWHLEFLEDPLADILEHKVYLLSCKVLLFLLSVCVQKVTVLPKMKSKPCSDSIHCGFFSEQGSDK